MKTEINELIADTMIRKLARGRMRYGSLDRYTTEIDGRKYDNAYLSCLIEQDQRRREEEYRKEAEMEAKGHYVADTMERKLERGHKRYGSRDMTFIYVGYGRYDANYLRNLIENDEKRREEEEKARHTEEYNEMPEIDDYFLDSTENISKTELAKILKELWENQRSWVKEQLPFDTLLEEVLSIYENDAEFERKHPRDWRGRFIEKVKDFLRRIFGLVKKKKPKVKKEKTQNPGKNPQVPDADGVSAKYGISELSREEAENLPNYYPETISGVKRGRPMTFKEADSGNVNPFYKTRQEAFVSNCQSCILAFIARLRGYDVKAKPYAGDDKPIVMLAKDIRRGFIIDEQGTHPDFVKRKRIKGAVGTMFFLEKNIRNNEIYCLFVDDPLCQDAHVIITGRQGEELYLYDPQKNRIFFKEKIQNYFYGKSCNKTQMFRIDNAAFNPYFIDMTMEAK